MYAFKLNTMNNFSYLLDIYILLIILIFTFFES